MKTEETKIIKKMHKLAMEKMLPERIAEKRGFDENGNQITLQKIVYKKGGFEIKSRWVNPNYKI